MLQTNVVQKIKTFILCSITFFFFQKSTNENIIRRIPIACWIPKATDTHSKYVTLLFHRNSGFADAPRCYVIRILPVLFIGHLFLVLECSVSTVHFSTSWSRHLSILRSGMDREIENLFPARSDVFRLTTMTIQRPGHTQSPMKWGRPFGPGEKSPPGPNLIVQPNPSAQDKVTLQAVSLTTLTVP